MDKQEGAPTTEASRKRAAIENKNEQVLFLIIYFLLGASVLKENTSKAMSHDYLQ